MAGFRAPMLTMCSTALNSRQLLIKYQITVFNTYNSLILFQTVFILRSTVYFVHSTLQLPGKKCKELTKGCWCDGFTCLHLLRMKHITGAHPDPTYDDVMEVCRMKIINLLIAINIFSFS